MPIGEIRVSRIRAVSECHRYGIASISMPWNGKVHVSSWINSSVRNRLRGWKNADMPDELAYDKTTRNAERARETVDKILSGVKAFEDEHKPKIIEREVPLKAVVGATRLIGTADMLAEIDGKMVLIDLKTGGSSHITWVQVSLYAALMAIDREVAVDDVACLHVPRLGPRTDQRWTFERRPYAPLMEDAAQWAWSLDQLCQGEWSQLTASPGIHCGRCPVRDCAVRAVPMKA